MAKTLNYILAGALALTVSTAVLGGCYGKITGMNKSDVLEHCSEISGGGNSRSLFKNCLNKFDYDNLTR